jgi:DNA-binding transcriptional ArsR family regulator
VVNRSEATLDAVFSALSDPTRRAIVARLAEGERTVSELAEPFPVSLPAVTKHLQVLESAGLLTHRKDGRVRRCRLVAEPIGEAAGWIERYRQFWDVRFDSLAAHLKRPKEER